ncbi:MAG: hypothetical protein NTX52_05385 [Planctomycetota bacterium]|nr:hypothetical protein [Planctomycetota bacterium]
MRYAHFGGIYGTFRTRIIVVTVRAELMKKASQAQNGVVFVNVEEKFNPPER